MIGEGTAMNSLGLVSRSNGNYDEAITFYQAGIDILKTTPNIKGIAKAHVNMGIAYQFKEEYDSALVHYNQGLEIFEFSNDENGIAMTLENIGSLYLIINRVNDAIKFGERALFLAKKNGATMAQRNASQLLFQAYKEKGQYSKSLEMHEKYIVLRDSVVSDENNTAMMQQRFAYDYDKKVAEDSVRNAEHELVIQAQLDAANIKSEAKTQQTYYL